MDVNTSQLKLRLPADLKTQVESLAKQNKRSTNAEIVDCVERALTFRESTLDTASSAIRSLVASLTNKVTKTANREFALDNIETAERNLLINLDKLPKEKKKRIIEALVAIVEST